MTQVRVAAALTSEPAAVRTRGLQRPEHRLLLTAGDATAAAVAVFLALWAWSITTGFAFDGDFLRRWIAWFALVPVWTALLAGSRRSPAALSIPSTVVSMMRSAVVLLALYGAAYFYAPPQSLPRLPALYFVWEVTLLTLGWRLVGLYVLTAPSLRRRAVVIGTGRAAARIVDAIRAVSPDVEVVAAVDTGTSDEGHDARFPGAGIPVCLPAELLRLIADVGASEVLVATSSVSGELAHDLLTCQQRGIAVVPMIAEYEQILKRVPVMDLPPAWLFTSLAEWVRSRDASIAAKRLLDIAGVSVGLVVLVITFPVIALLIWLESGTPIFYRQTRLGAGGRDFSLLKYRSMVPEAEEEGPQWAARGDARVTRVGRWLRRSRLDELPQFINVLKGDMSLVGPRPERPEFVARLERAIPLYRARLMVRPGLTGWAQVNFEYGASEEDATVKLEYDLYYIKHRSFTFDLWILVRTGTTLLFFRGR